MRADGPSLLRPSLRAAGLLALVVVAITCADAPTAPRNPDGGGSLARLGLAPSFSAAAASAYRGLTDFGFDVASARIRLTAADGTVAKDTVIVFPATQDSLRVDLSVPMQGSEQTFTALIELRDANGASLFTGSRLVTAHASSLPGGAPPTIPLEYSGPGHDARSLAVSPGDHARSASDVVAFTASALDASGHAVSDLLVRWTSSDAALGALTTTGHAAADLRGGGRRGTVVITAISPTGLSASTRLTLVPPPTRLVVIGGAGQTGVAGRALAQPFVVELQASDGLPVPNTAVTFRSVSAGGVVATLSATTDTAGRASTAITLGKTAGSYVFEAVSGTLTPASITAIATAAPAAALTIVSGDAQIDSIGRPLARPFVVKVTDEFGGAVAGATVEWTRLAGAGTLGAARTSSDVDGLASATYTLGNAPRVDSVSATLTGLSGAGTSVVFTARATPRAPASIQVRSGGGQSGTVGTTLADPLVALVTDALGNPVPGASVSWSAQGSSSVVFAPSQSITDADGIARTIVTLPAKVEVITAVASSGTLSATAPLFAVAGSASTFLLLQSLPSTILVGVPSATALRIQLADASGNATRVAGIVATATVVVTPGNRPPAVVTATSGTAGMLTFALPAYVGAIGSATITITAPGFTPLITPTITFVTGAIAQMHIATQPSIAATSGAPFAVQPVIRLEDAGGNPIAVSGVKITANVASGGGVLGGTTAVSTDAAGNATFSDLSITASAGLKTLGFKSGSLPDVLSNQIALANALVPVALDSVPGYHAPVTASSTAPLNTFKVRLVDGSSLTVARANVPVTVRATPFGAISPNVPLTGTITRLTDATGVATFDDVAFNVAAGTYVLTARADSAVLALPVFGLVDSLTLFTGPASTIAVSTGARMLHSGGGTIPAGVVTFQVADALGATTPSRSYSISFSTLGNCSIQPAFRTVNTGFTSSASVPIDMLGGTGGCVVSATTPGVAAPAVAQIAVPPSNATHVWFGSAGGGSSTWEGSSGWMPVPPMTAGSWPSSQSSDDAFVPFWSGKFTAPRLTVTPLPAAGPLAIRRLHVDSLATVDLGGQSLIVAGDSSGGVRSIAANSARIVNGRVLLYGAGALVTGGVFDRLSIGDTLSASSNFCASNSVAARLRGVTVLNALDVHCKLVVDSTVSAGTVSSFADAAQPGWILLASSTSELLALAGNFAGDSLVIARGSVKVTGGATFGGRLSMSSGSTLQVASDANFQGGGTLSSAQLYVGRNATFGGATSTGYTLVGGSLEVLGNFTQIVSGVPNVFVASSDHVTRFTGTTLQQVSFANAPTSGFSQVQFANTASGVELLGAASVGAGAANPRAALLAGAKLFVRGGVTFDVQGNLSLGSGSALDVSAGANVQISGACTGRTTNIATVTGAGTVNGTPINASTCTP